MKLETRNSPVPRSPSEEGKLKICIDCRFWGLEHTGLGRYTMRLVEELMQLDHENEYYLLFRKNTYQQLTTNNLQLTTNFHPILTEARHYTINEQLLLFKVLNNIKPDLLHSPHFNIPLLWKGKLVVTIHDLIKHESVGSQTTTLPMPIYWLKLLAYRFVFNQAIKKSSTIIVPSNFIKQQLISQFPNFPISRIKVTYEAPNEIYYQKSKTDNLQLTTKLLKAHNLTKPYLIYTGNAYPHKNLPKLIQAVKILNSKLETRLSFGAPAKEGNSKLTLAIVCARDVFRARVEDYVKQTGARDYVKFLGFVPDDQLRELYRHSLAFVTPSLLEGFGLSGLESLAAGSPVLSSNTSCLPEIYGHAAIYFDPHDPQDIANKITQVLNLKPADRKKLIQRGIKHSQTFSWTTMARQTLEIYKSFL